MLQLIASMCIFQSGGLAPWLVKLCGCLLSSSLNIPSQTMSLQEYLCVRVSVIVIKVLCAPWSTEKGHTPFSLCLAHTHTNTEPSRSYNRNRKLSYCTEHREEIVEAVFLSGQSVCVCACGCVHVLEQVSVSERSITYSYPFPCHPPRSPTQSKHCNQCCVVPYLSNKTLGISHTTSSITVPTSYAVSYTRSHTIV